jgi:chromosome segregation protein
VRLKQIKLIGFKSFVDPTVLNLSAPLVGIVGPNGCGKSNVIDAIRWVLGESSAKDLRGESMVDVIFNGSASRKPIAQAAIELLFDNLEGKLNREYANFSEVSIRREIDRNRQSEYYLNDKKCRKRDITDLFSGTGLLQNGYAIIGQGTVSKIIESNPENLRGFIEEAADISIYKKRRHETELRMQHTEENLTRLQDLLTEQVRLLEKLEKQQLAAKKYQNYQLEKQDYEIKLLSIKVFDFKQQLAGFEQEIKQMNLELEEYFSKKTALDLELEQQKLKHNDNFDNYSLIQEEYYKIGALISKLEQTLRYKKEQQLKCQNDLATINAEIIKTSEQYDIDNTTEHKLTQELLIIDKQYIEVEQLKQDCEKKYTLAQALMQSWNTKFNELHLSSLEAKNKADKIKHSIEQIENLSKELGFRVEKLNQEHINYDQNTLTTEILLLEKSLRKHEESQKEHNQQLLEISDLIDQKKIIIKNLLEQKNNLQTTIHQLSGKIVAIQSLQQDVLKINEAKSAWLNQANLLAESLFFEELIIEDGWELAVGVILGQYIDAKILLDLNEISIDLLKNIKDFKLVLIDKSLSLSKTASKIESDNNKISILSKISNNFALPNLFKNIYIANDLEEALAKRNDLFPEEYFVTKNGELIGFNWLLINKLDPNTQVLLRNKELHNLNLELEQLKFNLTELNSDIAINEQDLINMEQQQAHIRSNNQMEETSIRSLIAQISTKKSSLASMQERIIKIIAEIKEYQIKLQELSAKEISLRNSLETAIEESENYTQQQELLSSNKLELQADLENSSKENKFIINKFHNISLQKQELVTKINGVNIAKQRLLNQLNVLKDKQIKLDLDLKSNSSPLQPLELELEALLNDRLIKEKSLNISKIALDQAEHDINQLTKEHNDLNIVIEQYRAKLEQLKLEQNRVFTKLSTIMEDQNSNILEQSEIDIKDPEILQNKLNQVIKHLEKLGLVNLAAIEEFRLETERKQYLDLQQQDLTTALTTLKDAILKIDIETRKKFKTAFEEINNNFQKLFPKLFGGGSARLELDMDDWLMAGVSVLAQPPGKKNSSIYLLSGGEKALTAVALIFAIFQLNPAPFCILDEVDAPLDDANVTRFSELLLDLSPKVQFIFITHNKTTMKIANQLIGVTMKEPGVSRLVSVDVEQAVEMVS